jgi:hypothetical protein
VGEDGALDPREGKAAVVAPSKKWDAEAAKKWWAFQPCTLPSVPAVPVPVAETDAEWPRGDIYGFVLEGLEKKGIRPVGDADKLTLLRRVCFDLTGMPP